MSLRTGKLGELIKFDVLTKTTLCQAEYLFKVFGTVSKGY